MIFILNAIEHPTYLKRRSCNKSMWSTLRENILFLFDYHSKKATNEKVDPQFDAAK